MDGRSQLAYRLIRRAIAEGEFEPGSRLVEQRIGEMVDLVDVAGRPRRATDSKFRRNAGGMRTDLQNRTVVASGYLST